MSFDPARRRLLSGGVHDARPAQRLPWIVDESHFVAGCDRCGRCLDACPEGILVKGSGGFPEIDFRRGECTFCAACVESCPRPLFRCRSESPWSWRAEIGERCLTRSGITCRSCEEACEPAAIIFRPRPGGVARPELDPGLCTGCGACVSPCPEGAIRMVNKESIA